VIGVGDGREQVVDEASDMQQLQNARVLRIPREAIEIRPGRSDSEGNISTGAERKVEI
jgi:hypothetical protein